MIAIAADERRIVQLRVLSGNGYGRAYDGKQSSADFSNLNLVVEHTIAEIVNGVNRYTPYRQSLTSQLRDPQGRR
jgi:hypothetical protein